MCMHGGVATCGAHHPSVPPSIFTPSPPPFLVTLVCPTRQARWLVGHAGAFAAGLLLEGCAGRMQAQHAAAAPPPAGRPAAGRALPTILGTAALVLQAAGEGGVAQARASPGECSCPGVAARRPPPPTLAHRHPPRTAAYAAHMSAAPRARPRRRPPWCCYRTDSTLRQQPFPRVFHPAGLQHLSPFLHFTQGYQLGLHRAFE